eukprot:scaffold197568_cov31-Tisochrysis_lutea.AAC.2
MFASAAQHRVVCDRHYIAGCDPDANMVVGCATPKASLHRPSVGGAFSLATSSTIMPSAHRPTVAVNQLATTFRGLQPSRKWSDGLLYDRL